MTELRERLKARKPGRIPAEGAMKKAAVAAILRDRESESPGGERGLDVLMIRRAEHPKDPWSGHMAFPGGRVDPSDPDALFAAIRETKEEIGLDLFRFGSKLGELSHLIAMAHGKPLPMVVVPFVFMVEGSPELTLLDEEVQEAVWVPLSFLADRRNRRTIERSIAGATLKLPAYHYEERVIWGLTLRMLDELLSAAASEPER